jgi:hypothetical protein
LLGDKGLEVQTAFCEELGLGVPASTWHVARDGLAEAINFLALVTGSLGKRRMTSSTMRAGSPMRRASRSQSRCRRTRGFSRASIVRPSIG